MNRNAQRPLFFAPIARRLRDGILAPCASLAILLATSAGCHVGDVAPGDPDEVEFSGCEGDSLAHDTFNAFWTTLDREYAVFDVRLPDSSWEAVGAEACDQISAGMSDDELFDVLLGMAERLDDGHIQLVADDLGRDEDAWVTEYPFYPELEAVEGNVEDEYLDGDLTFAAEDEISWGLIGNIAYVSITSMDALSESEEEDDDRAAANAAMAQAMADVGDAEAMIVDVRANEGGFDSVSLDIASWFAGSRQVAWTEQVRNGPEDEDFGPPEPVFVEATQPGGFSGPVVLLTSGGTFSAAETFALAMRVRDDVTIVGEPTSGHFSDLIDGTLPNGWTFTFSGERYVAADGELYEARGVPVDVAVAFDVAALGGGQDVMLERALAILGR